MDHGLKLEQQLVILSLQVHLLYFKLSYLASPIYWLEECLFQQKSRKTSIYSEYGQNLK